jgi:CheY-like chemotaxis protein
MLELERELLTDEQYRVTTTSTDADATVLIGTLQPDLLLIDLKCQQVVGLDVLVSLTETLLTRDLPVVVTSTDKALL